jgi:hypothetical protein
MEGKKEKIQLDSMVGVGVKEKGLGLERNNSAKRPTSFLATRSGGERRLEKMVLFLASQIFQQMYLDKALNKSLKRGLFLKDPRYRESQFERSSLG